MTSLTAHVEQDPETQLYVGVVPGILEAYTQATSPAELRAALRQHSGKVGRALPQHRGQGCGLGAGFARPTHRPSRL